jgi:hydroxyethylthiazole kinase-like uncharacterized protein yjeF
MRRAHVVADVRAAEAALMATLPPGTLMSRAAAGLAAHASELLGRTAGARIVLLVGGGDNGGDALVAGARLARRGARVRAVLLDPGRAHRPGLASLRRAGGAVLSDGEAGAEIARAHLVLDGIVGIGGQPGLRPAAVALVSAATESSALVLAVDLPSGVDVDTGETPAAAVLADATATFGTLKVCHLVDPAAASCGSVRLVDIGLAHMLPAAAVEALEPTDVAALLPAPGRFADKYQRGVLGVRTGAAEYAGAGLLATAAATATGVGMVRVTGDDDAVRLVRERCPEVVLASGQVQAWVVGPGLDPADAPAVAGPVLASGLPTVLDAGALAVLREPGRSVGAHVLLTPHAGELARLLGCTRADVEASRLTRAREAARRFGATVLLKGSTTLVVAPSGAVRANLSGTPALATAGSGDVLAGVAGALLAAGLSALDAGSVAAWVHGMAGRLAAQRNGYPTAQHVLAALPHALLRARLAESMP